MTGRLREELSRIGDTAPVAHVDPDTWGRARRARTRDRVLVGAAAVAVLALVGGLGGILPSHDSTPVAGGSARGVPDHLYTVPASASSAPEADLAVGTGAAAWMSECCNVVVVGARDGSYHVLHPPGFPGRGELVISDMKDEVPLSLSPDGSHLAYAWFTAPRSDGTRRSGVRVLDLLTGGVRTVRIEARIGVEVTNIAWSPDGQWLSWNGVDTTRWDESGETSNSEVAGRIAPGATRSEAVPLPDDANRALAIGDDGAVWIATTNELTQWDGEGSATRAHPGRLSRTGLVAPDGDVLAVGVGRDGPVANPGRSTLATLIDARTGDLTRLKADQRGQGQVTTPLGWVDDRLLVTVSPFDRKGGPSSPQRLQLIGSGQPPTTVGTADYGVPTTLTVATDLMSLERPTVDRPEPEWPWSGERRALAFGLGIAAALGLLVGGLWLRRRTRPM